MNKIEKLQKEVLTMMQNSTMSNDMKVGWKILIPNMLQDELIGFKKLLENEYQALKAVADKYK